MISNIGKKIIFCLPIIILIAVGFYLKKKVNFYLSNKLIFPNVYVDKINVSGKNKEEFYSIFNYKNKALKKIKIEVFFNKEKIATFSGEALNLSLDNETAYLQAFLIGRSPYFLARLQQQLTSMLKLRKYFFINNIKYNKEIIDDFINRMEEIHNQPAQNALFNFQNGRVIAFKKEKQGKEIDSQNFYKNLNHSLIEIKNNPQNKVILLKIKVIEPEITLAKSNNFGIEELIAEGKSNFSHSSQERIHNIILASSKFHGILIPKGNILSFNETVGDVSLLTGYKPAYIIKEGKTVLGDGGGICQVSTTLFRAALKAGLEIIERHPHAYRVSYYENDSPPGFDATVFAPNIDLKIKNNTPAYLLIETEIDKLNSQLFFRFYGKKDQRMIEISPIAIWNQTPPPSPLYQDDPTLKKGVIKQIDFPAWGSKTNFHYKVTLNKKVIFEKDFFSFYKPWRAVFLVGIGD